ncbi:hypothetical protein HF086_005080 [Spodoptera exigua]|uniref:Uncharacterized protein n=1 Tax=Spodoptera exigua TaxID=7107 RepID=A0A922MIL9_SPOEX|nr:hypothetical protein HF086_005080 [Spodoptera exigua]
MMVLFCFCILLIYVPVSFSTSSDNDIHHTLFGKLGTFQDLFINGTLNEGINTRRKEDDVDYDVETYDIKLPDIFKFLDVSAENQTFDIYDYNLVNEQYNNFTQQFHNRTRRLSFYEKDDILSNDVIEHHKNSRLMSILIQFILHSKYEVGKALTQREVIRADKRYKLGYLFNRLRRLKTEMFKTVGVAYNEKKVAGKFFTVLSLMRSYERIVHFDVDIRDTCELIKQVYAVRKPYDVYAAEKKKENSSEK